METKYVVFAGPHYPRAVKIEPTADLCLVAQVDCRMDVLLAYTSPACYGRDAAKERLNNRKKGKEELLKLARILNHKRNPTKRKETLLKELLARREVQLNVYQDHLRAKKNADIAARRINIVSGASTRSQLFR